MPGLYSGGGMSGYIPAEHGGEAARIARDLLLEPEDLLDFSSSLNPLGPPPVVGEIIAQAASRIVPYPDTESHALRNAIAEKESLDPSCVMAGNGSTELIFLSARALRPFRAAILGPTFGEYARAVRIAGGAVDFLRMDVEGGFIWKPSEADHATLDRSQLCFICNPNNPSGTVLSKDMLLSLIVRHPRTVFVVDEAFVDFLPSPEEISLVKNSAVLGNLIVLRSFTKIYSIAGLRLGYAAGHPVLMERLREHKEPWTVNVLAQETGERLLEEDAFLARTRKWLPEERGWMAGQLEQFSQLGVTESRVNYLLLKIKDKSCTSGALFQQLLRHRLIIRDAAGFQGLNDSYIRVAVKTRAQNAALLSALGKVLGLSLAPAAATEE